MMRRIKNGEPVFHTHDCSEDRKGKVMTAEELHDFAVQVLMEEYSDTNAEVVKYDKKNPNEADFYFVNSGKRPNFSVGAFGEKKVNVLVVYKEETDKDISDIDTSWMVEEYRRTGAIPRVTFANAWCIYDVSAVDISPKALQIARQNAAKLGAEIAFSESDLLEKVQGEYDLIVANLPYVDKNWDWLSPELAYEPDLALYAEDSGLYDIKRLVRQAEAHLTKQGVLMLESDLSQHGKIQDYIENNTKLTLVKTEGLAQVFVKTA